MSSFETSSAAPSPEDSKKPSLRKAMLFGLCVSAVVFCLGVGSLLISSHSSSSSTTASMATSSVKVGSDVPRFAIPGVNVSGPVGIPTLASAKGHQSVLVFFASWCGPCKAEMPKLASAISHGAAGTARIIGVAVYDHPASLAAFVTSNHITFPVGNDASGQVAAGEFGFPALPETVFVNASGKVTSIHFGATTPALLKSGLAS